MTAKPVRTRFAPSPTGPLHIGSARSALFGWLLAKHHNGKFILRIEDTDQKRFVEGSLDLIMNGLRWLGIDWDEGPDVGGDYGPYTQSERLDLYQKWAKWLIDNDKAYYAYETSEELKAISAEREAQKLSRGYDGRARNLTDEQRAEYEAEGRKPVVRFKIPEGKTSVTDLVQGHVEFDNSTLQDIVLLKADGFPTYHFAHIIDDHFMEISHVTRANEWLPSLPVHVLLWQAMGWEMPEYAHLPVLLNPNGKGKLSKRHANFTDGKQKVLVLMSEFVEQGYLPEATMNFITNIGWNFGDDQEVFSTEEAIERFEISEVNPSNSAYPIEKLDWLNGLYIREQLDDEELARRLRPILEEAGYEVNVELLLKIIPVIKVRIKTLNDVVDMAGFFFDEEFKPATPEQLIQKKMDIESTKLALDASYKALADVDDFEHQSLYEQMKSLAKEIGLKNGQLFGVQRVAITGQSVSPPTFETMEILGKETTLERLKIALESLG